MKSLYSILWILCLPIFQQWQPLTSSHEATIEEVLQQLIEARGIPGISLSVIQKGEPHSFHVGMADIEKKILLEAKHRMLLGSVGKSFFAAQTLLLQQEGKLHIEDKVSKYLSEDWYRTLPNAASIRILNLLNHTSGIPEYVYAPQLWQTIKEQPQKQWTAKERLAFIQGSEAHFSVGEGWSYADANYIILGAVIEKITKKSIYDLVQQSFLIPQKLNYTEASTHERLDNITAAYTGAFLANLFGEKVSKIGEYGLNPQFEWTGGGFVTQSSDLVKWIDQLYKGKILNEAMTQQMFQPISSQTGKTDIVGYGLGVQVFETRYGRAYGHTGFMPGFNTLMLHLPDYDFSIAFQINADHLNANVKSGTSVQILLDEILPLFLSKNKSIKKSTTIYFVRHAEKVKDGTRDPALTTEGQTNAKRLAQLLIDKNITAIYSTSYQRTLQTAQPLADQLQQEIISYSPNDFNALFEMIAKNKGKNILVVGHSNTVPNMVNQLLDKEEVKMIEESEYGDLFKVEYGKKKQVLEQQKY